MERNALGEDAEGGACGDEEAIGVEADDVGVEEPEVVIVVFEGSRDGMFDDAFGAPAVDPIAAAIDAQTGAVVLGLAGLSAGSRAAAAAAAESCYVGE